MFLLRTCGGGQQGAGFLFLVEKSQDRNGANKEGKLDLRKDKILVVSTYPHVEFNFR